MDNQPKWKLIARLGDCNPATEGGQFVYVDETGVYCPEVASIHPLINGNVQIHRFSCEKCTFINGVFSDNKFHPEKPAWFADELDQVASFIGETKDGLINLFLSDDPRDNAVAWETIGQYFGYENLDYNPIELTVAQFVNIYQKLQNQNE